MPVLAAFTLVPNLYALVFGLTSLFFITTCQELHKWAHTSKADALPGPEWLQSAGLAISRKAHLLHHRAPYENNYCIVSGHCNHLLDSLTRLLRVDGAADIRDQRRQAALVDQ